MKKLNDFTREEYDKLLNIGMLYEFYPHATGNWNDDVGVPKKEPLDPYIDEVLTILAEEAAEIIQECCKIKRYGLYSKLSEESDTNIERLEKELGDFQCMVDMLHQTDLVSYTAMDEYSEQKVEKLQKWSNLF